MNGLTASVADSAPGAAGSAVPLASWYTQGISDGFGDRLLMSDSVSESSLELLRFRPDLANVPGFEETLRDSVARTVGFEHAAFSRVRAVESLESNGGLALVSAHTPGRRLSEMFQGRETAKYVHPAFVAWLIRWLTPALADFTKHTTLAHGTITLERIVLAPDGRPVLVEHVLGRAIELLRLSPDRLWRHFGMVVPPSKYGGAVLDERTDVFQLASVALSLLLGRRVTPAEHASLDQLLDEFAASSEGRRSSFTAPLCRWLERALRTDGGGFRSAAEACDGSRELSHAPRPEVWSLNERNDVATELTDDVTEARRSHPEAGRTLFVTADARSGIWTARTVAAGLAVVVGIQAVAIAVLLAGRADPTTLVVPVLIESPQAGDIVMVDGREVGVTPIEVNVGGSTRTINLVSAAPPAAPAADRLTTPAAPKPPVAASPPAAVSRAQRAAAVPAPAGELRLVTPIDLQVFEDGRLLGSSGGGSIAATPGVHHLELVNTALGYRSSQAVDFRSGEVRTLTIQPPGGRVSINAVPWAQVWIDGKPVGDTPIAYLPVAAGEHEIVFRHPDFGERRETLTVQSGAETRISATFGQ